MKNRILTVLWLSIISVPALGQQNDGNAAKVIVPAASGKLVYAQVGESLKKRYVLLANNNPYELKYECSFNNVDFVPAVLKPRGQKFYPADEAYVRLSTKGKDKKIKYSIFRLSVGSKYGFEFNEDTRVYEVIEAVKE